MNKPKWCIVWCDIRQAYYKYTSLDSSVTRWVRKLKQNPAVLSINIYPTSTAMTGEEWLAKQETNG